ncbi:hypothetical protein RUND412_003527 [Rhizina undulata]
MICLLASLVFLLNPQATYSLPEGLQKVLPSYLQSDHNGWWGDLDSKAASATHGSGQPGDWNILYHLGGNGPWVEKVDEIVPGGIKVPDGCEVDMVHMMSRHAERFPTKNAGARMIQFVNRVKDTGVPLKGDLEFLNDWEYISEVPSKHHEQLTTTGPYSGILEAFTTGVKLSTRYQHLWNDTVDGKTLLWASDCDRVIDTARYFSAGFFGLESESAKLVIVSEAPDKAGDTLTPGDTCKNYVEDEQFGHNYGYEMLYKFRATYLGDIAKRLEIQNPGFNFSDAEVFSMQEMCGFETTVRGRSKWCDVFTKDEWLKFEYARDVIHYYRAGPGNKYAKAMGWLWLNATANLIQEGPESAGPLYFSFVHDGDIVPMLASLGLFEDAYDLTVDHVYSERKWKTSQITPMGGRILLERLSCPSSSPEIDENEIYVRFNVNDGIVALDGCSDGPGGSCSLNAFMEHVKRRGEIGGDFREVCGLPEDAVDRLTFLRQPRKGEEVVEEVAVEAEVEEAIVAEPVVEQVVKPEEKKMRRWWI